MSGSGASDNYIPLLDGLTDEEPDATCHLIYFSNYLSYATQESTNYDLSIPGFLFPSYSFSTTTLCSQNTVTGLRSGSLGGLFLLRRIGKLRVFGPSGIIYRPSDCLSLLTIPLSGFMEKCSHYIPFSSQS